MRFFVLIFNLFALMLLSNVFVFAQTPPNRENTNVRNGISRDDVVRGNLEQRMRNLRNSKINSNRTRKAYKRNRLLSFKPVFSEELRQSLIVDNTTKSVYSELLIQENTGIFKIIAFENCSKLKKKKKRRNCQQRNVNVREFANSYSFRENKLAVFARSDLSVRNGYFVAGRHSVQTILVDLGDVVINDVTKESLGVSFLTNFKPSIESTKMDEEYNMFLSGVVAGNYADQSIENPYSFSKATKIVENHTYAIRSIAYRPENSPPLEKDKDLLIVFRVIEKDELGNVTVLWKQLTKKEGKVMKFSDTGAKDLKIN